MSDWVIRVGNDLLDLGNKARIALTKRINAIGEIEKIKFDFSQNISIKNTKQNRLILGMPDTIQSLGDFPYKRNAVTVLYRGNEVLTNGLIKVLDADRNRINCVVYSGVKELFDDIEGLTLRDINAPELMHPLNITSMLTRFNTGFQDGYIYPFFEWGLTLNPGQRLVNAETLLPWVFVRYLWDKIFEQAGYNVVYPSGLFDNDVLSIAGLAVPEDVSTQDLFGSRSAALSYTFTAPGSQQNVVQNLFYQVTFNPRNIPANAVGNRLDLTMLYEANYSYSIQVNVAQFFVGDIDLGTMAIRVIVNGAAAFTTPFQQLFNSQNLYNYSFDVELNSGDTIGFQIVVTTLQVVAGADIFSTGLINVQQFGEADKITYKAPINPIEQLPEITQIDFLKSVSLKYGLVWSIDDFTGVIHVKPFDNLIDNIPNAEDWSDIIEDGTISFEIGDYAQKNWFRYTGDVSEADGFIECNNENLEAETDVITLPWASFREQVAYISGSTRFQSGVNVAFSTEFPFGFDSIDNAMYARLQRATLPQQMTIQQLNPPLQFGTGANVTFCRQLKFEDLFPLYWNVVQRSLNNVKILSCPADIKATTFLQRDQLVPVYASQHNAYFYCEVIENWQGDEKTVLVKLVRI
jgi:hypothetical protein